MPVERWNDERLDELATSVADLRSAAGSLLETAIIHQRNFEAIVTRIDQMQSEIRGLQTENRRILDRLDQA